MDDVKLALPGDREAGTMDIEKLIEQLRANNIEDNCHDCALGYYATEAAAALAVLRDDAEGMRSNWYESVETIVQLRAELEQVKRERGAAVIDLKGVECCTNCRLRELAQAGREGRCVVSPCKVGDTVWTNFAMSGWYFRDRDKPYEAKVVFVGLNGSDEMGGGLFNVVYGKHDHMMQFRFSDIGKTVFLTREEAKEALEGGGDDAD